jgi:hypothetical protein
MEVRAERLEAQMPAARRRRCEREEATARVWGSRLLRETTTEYVYCLIIIKGVHAFI